MNYGPGQLPACNAPCPLPNGTSFPNVRNGSYPIWNIVRIITDASGPNKTAVQDLLTAGQAEVNGKVPDFVPFVCNTAGPKCNGEPGLVVFVRTTRSPGSQPLLTTATPMPRRLVATSEAACSRSQLMRTSTLTQARN